jgi:hypothetical protein
MYKATATVCLDDLNVVELVSIFIARGSNVDLRSVFSIVWHILRRRSRGFYGLGQGNHRVATARLLTSCVGRLQKGAESTTRSDILGRIVLVARRCPGKAVGVTVLALACAKVLTCSKSTASDNAEARKHHSKDASCTNNVNKVIVLATSGEAVPSRLTDLAMWTGPTIGAVTTRMAARSGAKQGVRHVNVVFPQKPSVALTLLELSLALSTARH